MQDLELERGTLVTVRKHCETCDSWGEIEVPGGVGPEGQQLPPKYEPCTTCNGKGTVLIKRPLN